MEPIQSEAAAVAPQVTAAVVPVEVSAEEREKAHEHIRNLQTAMGRERRMQKAAKRDPAVREMFEENQALGATIEGLRLKHESDRDHFKGKLTSAETRISELETELTSAYGKSAGFQARIVELEAKLKSLAEVAPSAPVEVVDAPAPQPAKRAKAAQA